MISNPLSARWLIYWPLVLFAHSTTGHFVGHHVKGVKLHFAAVTLLNSVTLLAACLDLSVFLQVVGFYHNLLIQPGTKRVKSHVIVRYLSYELCLLLLDFICVKET